MAIATPLISVIIPTRNAGVGLGACLDALAAQEFTGFDVHVVDAASEDATLATAAAYRYRLGMALHCWPAPGSGVYEAMNLGIARSQGEWLYFLGADDVPSGPAVFRDVATAMAEGGTDLIYGDADFRNAGHRYGGPFSLDRLLFEGNLCHQAVFYHRRVFDLLGGYSLRYPVWADWDLNIRCFRHPALRTRWLDRVIVDYNDAAGVSRVEDPVFRLELPVTLRHDLRRELRTMKARRSYRLGRLLFGWLD